MKDNQFMKETYKALYRELDDSIKTGHEDQLHLSMLWAPHIEKDLI